MSDMRILMLAPQFHPMVGGYERAAKRLSRELVRQDCLVHVVTERRERTWLATEVVDGLTIHRLPVVCRKGLHILSSLVSHAVFLLLHGRRYDVWHQHQYGAHATVAVLLGKLLSRPVVLKLTNSAHQGIAQALTVGRMSQLQRWAHRQVAACLAVSAETAVEAERFGIPPARIARIGNGLDLDTYSPVTAAVRPVQRQRLGLPERPVAIWVGRLAEEKNPLGLVDAWSMAYQRFSHPWTLVMVGDGPLREALESHIRTNRVDQSVVLVGHSDHVPEWLRAADLFVLSSHNEGLANTLLEAMACALPSVVTAVSGMDELIRSNGAGVVVPCGDPLAFADALVALHDDEGLRGQMGCRAREGVQRDYEISAVAARVLALYRQVAKFNHVD